MIKLILRILLTLSLLGCASKMANQNFEVDQLLMDSLNKKSISIRLSQIATSTVYFDSKSFRFLPMNDYQEQKNQLKN
jgi:uncharacterized protein YcfL